MFCPVNVKQIDRWSGGRGGVGVGGKITGHGAGGEAAPPFITPHNLFHLILITLSLIEHYVVEHPS